METPGEKADELLRITEKLAGRGGLDAVRVVAAMVVLGRAAAREEHDSLWSAWDHAQRRTRLDRATAGTFPLLAAILRSEWEQWRTEQGGEGLFLASVPFEDFPEARLGEVARAVSDLLSPSEMRENDARIGEVFDRFLSLVGERMGRAGGEFFTPRSVNELIVRLADLRLGMLVGDFYAGAGGTLVAALARVGAPAMGETPVSGADINGESVFLARVNLHLHGADPSLVRHEDTLTSWKPTDGQGRFFDRILSNPPFALSYDPGTFREPQSLRGRTSESRAELMVLQQMLASLRPGGRAIMAMAHGPLFRGGQERDVRRALLARGEIEAVIGIGPNLFYGTAVPACLLVVRRPEEGRQSSTDVLFVNAEREVTTGRNQNRLEPRHIEKIVRVCDSKATIPGFSRIVPREEIARNSHDLHVRRYVEPVEKEDPLAGLEAALNGGVPLVEVRHAHARFHAFGIDVERLFAQRRNGYLLFPDEDGYKGIAERVPGLCAPAADTFEGEFQRSWPQVVHQADTRSFRRTLGDFRRALIDLFCEHLLTVGVLDEYELAGVFAQWWAGHSDEIAERFYGDRESLGGFLAGGLDESLLAQARELIRVRQKALVDTVHAWGEHYGEPLSQLWERSAAADQRFQNRLRGLGLDPGPTPEREDGLLW